MQRALTRLVFPAAHGGRLVLVAALMGLLAAAVLAAGDTARAQATTHEITRGADDAALQTSLNAVFASGGATLAAVSAGDTITFGPGEYEDIGRSGVYLLLNKANLTVRGAADPRLGKANGVCKKDTHTILTGSSAFSLRAANITLEHFCFQNIDDGSLAHANPQNLAPISLGTGSSNATVRRNRIDNTIGIGVTGRDGTGTLASVTIEENEFIDIGLIATNGAGENIQPRHTGKEPSAIDANTGRKKTNLKIVNNLFHGGAWSAVVLNDVTGSATTISGNTFRNMAKSALHLRGFRSATSTYIVLDNNTFEGNNRAAWRVVETANWLDDLKLGLAGLGVTTKLAAMESPALQTLMRLTKAKAKAVGMSNTLYDKAVASSADSVYRDPRLHAAVMIVGPSTFTISNSTFTNNHNSIAICGHDVCRVDGLEEVGSGSDPGRAPAYISPWASAIATSSLILSGNQFDDSDTRGFGGPGSIGNHVVIGHFRNAVTDSERGGAVGTVDYRAENSFTGSGGFGGAAADYSSGISMESKSAAVDEGGDVVFNLTISPPARAALTVNYSVTQVGTFAGTLPDADDTAAGTQIKVAKGSTRAVLTIPTVFDPADTADGSITVTIDAGTGDLYSAGATATVAVRNAAAPPPPPPPVIVAAPPPPVFIPPPPPSRKDEVAVVDGAAKLEANKVTVNLAQGSLPENVEVVEATVTKLTRSKTPDAPDGGRFRIAYAAVYEIELEATLADETTQTLTEFAAPVTVCLPIPRAVRIPVVLHYDAETEEWVKLPLAPSSEEGQACVLTDSFSVYAVANEADHLEGLSANEINDFAVWEADYPLPASELLSAIPDADLLWLWNDETWTGYATFEGEPIPGAVDFPIANGNTLWLGDGGSGGDTGEEGEEGEEDEG